jgi:serine/threonine-protein kinase
MGSWTTAWLAAVVWLSPGIVLAQATAEEKIGAEALFDEGKKLLSEGQLAPACEKLEASQRIDPAVGTLLYLAECYEKSGRTASAWATFREASSAARASGQADRARIGQERATRLEPRLVRLTIRVENENASIEGFQVKRRGEVVGKGLWGVPIPVDPGEQLIEASAPGYQPYSQRVSVDKQPGSATVPVLVKLVTVEPVAPKPSAAPPTQAAVISSTAAPGDAPAPSNAQVSVGITLGVVGVIGVGAGTYFGLRARSKNNEAKDHCPNSPKCNDREGVTLTDEAGQAATLSNIAFGVGGAALVAGGILLVTAPSKARKSGFDVRFVPVAGAREVGAELVGSF